ncbi:phospholipase-like protein, partial [Tanacetum coccineum]
MQVCTMPQAKKGPIIVGQHYGLSDLSGFQNTQGFPRGGPTFPTQASTSFFEGTYATPSYDHHTSSRYPYSHLATPNWQTPMPQPGNVPWSSQHASAHNRDVGLVNPNLMNRERMEARPSMYVQSPYTVLPPTTVLPKRQGDKSRNKGRNATVAPFNLGNAFVDDNEVDDEVLITSVRDTDDYIMYENVDPSKVRREQLVLNLYMGGYHVVDDPNTEGWLSGDQMNAWIELLIRDRPQGAKFTVAKSGTSSFHLRSKMFIIQTDPHIIGTLDGSTCLCPSWDEVDWVYMPINAGGDHWVTGAINLPNSRFYVFDSLHSE